MADKANGIVCTGMDEKTIYVIESDNCTDSYNRTICANKKNFWKKLIDLFFDVEITDYKHESD